MGSSIEKLFKGYIVTFQLDVINATTGIRISPPPSKGWLIVACNYWHITGTDTEISVETLLNAQAGTTTRSVYRETVASATATSNFNLFNGLATGLNGGYRPIFVFGDMNIFFIGANGIRANVQVLEFDV